MKLMPLRRPLSSLLITMLAALVLAGPVCAADPPAVLVYTRNGKGFVHDNIAAGVAMLRKLAERGGFQVEVSDDPAVFSDESLARFASVVFANTNNEAFLEQGQRDAFQRFIRAGGGFVGIHSACGSERKWPWFWDLLGGKFRRHAPRQDFAIHLIDKKHPATGHLPETWQWKDDEFYYLDHLNPAIHVLLVGDLAGIKDAQRAEYPARIFGDRFPLAWCQEFDGGRQFYTALGHQIAHYDDPAFQQHVLGGILWTMERPPASAQ